MKNWLRTPGQFLKWCYYPARRSGGWFYGQEGSRARIYRAAAALGTHQPVGLTHRKGVLYHQVPFRGLRLEYSRTDLEERLLLLKSELGLKGRSGLDLGCAVGGLSFSLQLAGASMTGVERDSACVGVAEAIEMRFRTGVKFVHSDVVDFVSSVSMEVDKGARTAFDFVFFFSAFNWVVEGMDGEAVSKFLSDLARIGRTIVMDSAIGGKGQANLSAVGIHDEESFVRVVSDGLGASKARKIGENNDWYGRGVYVFEKEEV